ncbi:hypothetical protein Ga0074812_10352 [Parafrankia irregularis]|uniref:Uncharacterized protein n=1 Tax=Parafrankia irregularis TaxID=795642 RepID=A0A0S4QHG9_9ACTN|nr:hypothetical protein Ga0074812_10352 [Parafrankia irregularis]
MVRRRQPPSQAIVTSIFHWWRPSFSLDSMPVLVAAQLARLAAPRTAPGTDRRDPGDQRDQGLAVVKNEGNRGSTSSQSSSGTSLRARWSLTPQISKKIHYATRDTLSRNRYPLVAKIRNVQAKVLQTLK